MEMLTMKECTEAVKGLSEHTVRKLVTQGKVHYIRICSVILQWACSCRLVSVLQTLPSEQVMHVLMWHWEFTLTHLRITICTVVRLSRKQCRKCQSVKRSDRICQVAWSLSSCILKYRKSWPNVDQSDMPIAEISRKHRIFAVRVEI